MKFYLSSVFIIILLTIVFVSSNHALADKEKPPPTDNKLWVNDGVVLIPTNYYSKKTVMMHITISNIQPHKEKEGYVHGDWNNEYDYVVTLPPKSYSYITLPNHAKASGGSECTPRATWKYDIKYDITIIDEKNKETKKSDIIKKTTPRIGMDVSIDQETGIENVNGVKNPPKKFPPKDDGSRDLSGEARDGAGARLLDIVFSLIGNSCHSRSDNVGITDFNWNGTVYSLTTNKPIGVETPKIESPEKEEPSSNPKFQIIDPDSNKNPNKVDIIKFSISSSTIKKTLMARETGKNTGVFVSTSQKTWAQLIDAKSGDTLTIKYKIINKKIQIVSSSPSLELDQKTYSWTDKVYITLNDPKQNINTEIPDQALVNILTRDHSITEYSLIETGSNTGVFTGSVRLTGFSHDANGDGEPDGPTATTGGTGPTDGFIETSHNDSITVSMSEEGPVPVNALIRWNIGEASWLKTSYPTNGHGTVRIIDPDMNLNPEAIDNVDVTVYSSSNSEGIILTLTETNEATGIFEGTVSFTTSVESFGNTLSVRSGDTITVEYEDMTLPSPYTHMDKLDIAATSTIK